MRLLQKINLILTLCFMLFSVNIRAETLDYSSINHGWQFATQVVLPQATITSFGMDIYLGVADDICAITSSFVCEADLQIEFTSAVSDLSFDMGGYNSGDMVDIKVFNGTSLLTTLNRSADGFVDLSAYANITKLYFANSSTGGGFSYSNFQFTSGSPVPEAKACFMMMVGLALLVMVALRKRV